MYTTFAANFLIPRTGEFIVKVPNSPQSSFGIPTETREQIDTARARTQAKSDKPQNPPPVEGKVNVVEDWPTAEKAGDPEDSVRVPTPLDILKSHGIEPSENDYHSLLFRGFVEKSVNIASIPGGKKLTAKIKTLTTEEVEAVDELVAKDIENIPMTQVGLDARRSSWSLAFAVTELNEKPVCKPVMNGNKIDIKATAAERREVLTKMSPYIIDKVIRIHAEMSAAFSLLVTDTSEDIVKK